MLHGGPCPDFAVLAARGIRFAVLSCSAGMGWADPRFAEKILSAKRAGILCGAYHRLTAESPEEAIRESDFFLSCLSSSPVSPRWALCRLEPGLPLRDPAGLPVLWGIFRERIRRAGYEPLLYTTEKYLRYFPERVGRNLCLAAWGIPESRALTRNPLFWEYGEGSVGPLSRAVLLKGYITSLPDSGGDVPFLGEKSMGNGEPGTKNSVQWKKAVIFPRSCRYTV